MHLQPYVISTESPHGAMFALTRWIFYILASLLLFGASIHDFDTAPALAAARCVVVAAFVAVLVHVYRRERSDRLSRIRRQVRFAVIEQLPHLARQRAQLLHVDSYGHVKNDEWSPYIPTFLEKSVGPRLDQTDKWLFKKSLPAETQYVEDCLINILNRRPLDAEPQQ